MQAKDADGTANGNVTYNIISGDDAGIFVIHPVTGQLTTMYGKIRDYSQQATYSLVVQAQDGNSPQSMLDVFLI